jgi:LysM repeat protein
MQHIRVRVGQSLSTIALRYNTTVDAIMAANPSIKDRNQIHIGDRLDIPGKDDPIAESRGVQRVPLPTRRPADVDPPEPTQPAFRNVANLSEADIQALMRAVAAEARGERPEVWTAVAQTIINYARETGTPIGRVTRSSYLSSNFDGNRRFYHMPLNRIPNHEAIRRAVLHAADYKSPIGRRSHFYDTSIGMPSWGDRHSRVQIGHVIFLNAK